MQQQRSTACWTAALSVLFATTAVAMLLCTRSRRKATNRARDTAQGCLDGTCFCTPSVMSTWLRRQLTHMFDGLLAMGTPHRQHSLRHSRALSLPPPEGGGAVKPSLRHMRGLTHTTTKAPAQVPEVTTAR